MPNVGSTPNRHRFDFQIAATRKLPKPTAQQSVAVEAASVSRTALIRYVSQGFFVAFRRVCCRDGGVGSVR
jgi:hypothetical protein